MKAFLVILLFSVVALATDVDLGSVEITNSTLINMNIGSVPYGGVIGNAKFRLSGVEWYPDNVWLVPENYQKDKFNYTGKSYRLPSEMNLTNNCASSMYTFDNKTAFKATVSSNGDFCILADPGRYKIIAEY